MPSLTTCAAHSQAPLQTERYFTATVKVTDEEARTDEGQLLAVLDGSWLTSRGLDALFRSSLFEESATLETREQHVRIANSLPQMLDCCMHKGLASSTA